MVAGGNERRVRPRFRGEQREEFGEGWVGWEEASVEGRMRWEAAHVGVGGDDVVVPVVKRGDGAGLPPVDEVAGKEEDGLEGEVGDGGDLD